MGYYFITYMPGKRMEKERKRILDILDKMDEGNRKIWQVAKEIKEKSSKV